MHNVWFRCDPCFRRGSFMYLMHKSPLPTQVYTPTCLKPLNQMHQERMIRLANKPIIDEAKVNKRGKFSKRKVRICFRFLYCSGIMLLVTCNRVHYIPFTITERNRWENYCLQVLAIVSFFFLFVSFVREYLPFVCPSIQVMSNQEAVDFIKDVKDPQAAARQLTEAAVARKSKDDISCIVVKFN